MKKLILFILLLCVTVCNAQKAVVDTIKCNNDCIKNIIEIPSNNKTGVKIFVIYQDKNYDIDELIPISKSVYDYIQTCNQYGITPNLGIRVRNGQITSIVKYKRKLRIK